MTQSVNTQVTPERNSNLELLRIVCMVFIVLHHFLLYSAFPEYGKDVVNGSALSLGAAQLLNGFLCVAVNCFVLISGYFGIKFKVKKLFSLYLMCVFYGLIGYLCHLWLGGYHVGRSILNHTLFVFSHGRWWFINCYLVLFFMAPFLNKAISSLSKKSYLSCLLLFTVLNVYFGFFWGQDHFNQYGYSAAQFVYLYLIGGYIKRFAGADFIRKNRQKWACGFALLSIIIGLTAIILHRTGHSCLKAYYYNNPLVLCSSVCFFYVFASLDFKSRFINSLASGVLAAYLIQSNEFLGGELFFPSLQSALLSVRPDIGTEWLILVVLSLVFVFISIYIDKIRAFVMIPVWWLYNLVTSRADFSFVERTDD